MSIFNFFKKKENNSSNEIQNYDIEYLLSIPINERGDSWKQMFLPSIIKAPMSVGFPETVKGPDGMEYTNLTTASDENDPDSIMLERILVKNLSAGLGILINGNKEVPDWVFTYGDIVDFYLNGEFYSGKIQKLFGGEFVTDKLIFKRQARVGQPSELFLPKETRTVIRNFLNSFGIKSPKICLILWIETNELNLAFNIVPALFENLDKEVFQKFLNFLGWYLPRHYVIVSFEEDESFKPL